MSKIDPAQRPESLFETDPSLSPERDASLSRAAAPRTWWMKVLGLRRRDGRYIRFLPTRWGIVLAFLLFAGIGGGGFAHYSMQPDFCRSCHLMEPYYQAWHDSTHKNVPCTDCHFEPGLENTIKGKWQASSQAIKYITDTYGTKPHAQVHDSSCMRSGCHEQRLLEGRSDWTVKSVTGQEVTIKFDHTPHLTEARRGKQLRCTSCHSQMVQGQHITVTLDTCFLCHFTGLEHGRNEQAIAGCKGCHDSPRGEIKLSTGVFRHSDYVDRGVACESCHSDSIRGTGEVPRQFCWNCHNDEKLIARYGETRLMHQAHVTDHKVECTSCHVQIEHHLYAGAPRELGKPSPKHLAFDTSCGSCHEQSHGGPAQLYRGVGARGVPDMPSPMHRAQVDCIACHKSRKETKSAAQVVGQTFVAAQESCNYCHESKYDGELDKWRQTIKSQLVRAQDQVEQTRQALKGKRLPALQKLEIDRLLDDANHNIRLIELGHGVHNVNYSTAALNVAVEKCQQAKQIAGIPTTQPAQSARAAP